MLVLLSTKYPKPSKPTLCKYKTQINTSTSNREGRGQPNVQLLHSARRCDTYADLLYYLLSAFYERLKYNVESVVVAHVCVRVRVCVHEARVRVCARHVGVVVARLARRPHVAPRQRPALAHHYVVVASMSLRNPIKLLNTSVTDTPSTNTVNTRTHII